MKRLFLSITFLLPGMFLTAQDRGMKPVQVRIEGTPTALYQQSHALLIGISIYTNGWSSLPGVSRDIPRVKAALENNGFQVDVVMNPSSKDALDNAFSDFISKYGNSRDNRLLIYYAGHGHTIKTDWGGELGYIVSADAPLPSRDNSSPFQRKAMEMAQIDIYAKRIQSKHALFIFDACFAGTIFSEDRSGVPEYISYNTTKPVRQFITSGSADETVADASFFCDQFIEALDGKADSDKDGYLTGSELGYFLKKEVIKFSNNRQHPQSGKINDSRLDDGDFVFVMAYTGIPSPPRTLTPQIEEERTIVKYGKLELTTEIGGALYMDGTYMKQVDANTAITINNLTEGNHTIKVSGTETNEKSFTILPNQTTYGSIDKKRKDLTGKPCPGMPTFTDPRDGQVYPTVKIGTQCWFKENLNIGTRINGIQNQDPTNPTIEKYCYDDNESNCDSYGGLYQWDEMMKNSTSPGVQGICPEGWHIPTDEEWTTLTDFLGGSGVVAGKMKSTRGWYNNGNGSNSSGFTALPGGYRTSNGDFYSLPNNADFWSSSEYSSTNPRYRNLYYDNKDVGRYYNNKTYGFSCRCLQD